MKNKHTAKGLVALLTLVFALSILTGCGQPPAASDPNVAAPQTADKKGEVYQRTEVITSSQEAMQLLVDGNNRFKTGNPAGKDISSARRSDLAAKGQKPFVTIVSCSDSRVPPEVLFDQALGDLFVIRVAGNVLDPVAMGSVEYGVEHLQTPLVVVMGHENCGAVKATVDGGEAPGSIGAIVDKIKPSLEKARAAGATQNDLYEKTTDENVKAVIAEIEKSPIIKHMIESGKVKVVGAKYHLDSGEVTFDAVK